jgi:hypothetical protein
MITVVIPSSPIESHPDTEIIRAVVDSVYHHLPSAPILLTFDGLRASQEDWRDRYEKHVRECEELTAYDPAWRNVTVYSFIPHLHQSGMMRRIINLINTPLLCYVEHDMMIRTGREIDFAGIADFIMAGHSSCVRLYRRNFIPDAHYEFMHGRFDADIRFLRTSQWPQNVHIATVDMYRTMLDEFFSPEANCYIEDAVWGRLHEQYPRFKMHIYYPETDIKYLLHLDGRGSNSKYEEDQVY